MVMDFKGKPFVVNGDTVYYAPTITAENLKNYLKILPGNKTEIKTVDMSACDKITTLENTLFYSQFKTIEKIVLPPKIKKIVGGMFPFFSGTLKEVEFGNMLEEIGEGIFKNTQLENLDFPDSLKKIDKSAFRGCKKLKEVKFPQGLQEIGKEAFYDCKDLKNVVFSEGLQEIGEEAFSYSGVEELKFPSSLKSIGSKAFYECKNLKEVVFLEGLLSVGSKAFEDTGVKSLTLPSTIEDFNCFKVKYIDLSVCSKIKKIDLEFNTFDAEVVYLPPLLEELHIPQGASGMTDHNIYGPATLKNFSCESMSVYLHCYSKRLKTLKNLVDYDELRVKHEYLEGFEKMAETEDISGVDISEMPIEEEYFWD